MNLIWRFLFAYIFSRFASKTDLQREASTSFTVLPTDIDVLMHMNNGRYFSLADIARMNFLIRARVFHLFSKHKIYPVVASETMRFRKSLRLFQRFQLTTKILGWDDRFFYLQHHYKSDEEIYAFCLVKSSFIEKGKGAIAPSQVAKLLGVDKNAEPLPTWVKHWQEAEQSFVTATTQNV